MAREAHPGPPGKGRARRGRGAQPVLARRGGIRVRVVLAEAFLGAGDRRPSRVVASEARHLHMHAHLVAGPLPLSRPAREISRFTWNFLDGALLLRLGCDAQWSVVCVKLATGSSVRVAMDIS
jgi:hypothetical protein